MKYVWIFLTGIAGGLLGGMGMGGGTLLIPALTLFFGLDQSLSQAINLVAFIPMATGAIIVHAKNKLIKTEGLIPIAACALAVSVGASFLEQIVNGVLQKKIFGIFLCLLALYQFFTLQKGGNSTENAKFAKKKKPHGKRNCL